MKITVLADSSNLDAQVAHRFGISAYLIIVDLKTLEFEAVPNPGVSGKRAAGVQTVVLAISKKVDAVLTGYCSPTAMKYLTDNGIEVITGVKGTVSEAVAQFRNQIHPATIHRIVKPESTGAVLIHAFKNTGKLKTKLLTATIFAAPRSVGHNCFILFEK